MPRLSDVVQTLEAIAPPRLAQSWDNVGLLAGAASDAVRGIMLCIDMTADVVEEAIARPADLVVAYHPPLFRPVKSLRLVDGDRGAGPAAIVRAVRAGIAVYSPHTALDAADGGTGEAIAALCGAKVLGPLDHAVQPAMPPDSSLSAEVKLTVFVPREAVERVGEALFAAGAGRIGLYERCSFRIPGTGTFFGGAGADPVVGKAGRFESVEEIRLETVCPRNLLPEVVAAMRAAHPYEEPAFDLVALVAKPQSVGIGRVARLPKPTPLAALAGKLSTATRATAAQFIGDARRRVQSLAILVGSAGRVQEAYPRAAGCDVLITGEIRHHDAVAIRGRGEAAIALGHWHSERPVLDALQARLKADLPKVATRISRADRDPFAAVPR